MQGPVNIHYRAYLQGNLRHLFERAPPSTDFIIFSFGAWLKFRRLVRLGPDMDFVCSLLDTSHPFKFKNATVVWMTPPPYRHEDGRTISVNPPHRPYNVQVCVQSCVHGW
jgi:hypothetical protein